MFYDIHIAKIYRALEHPKHPPELWLGPAHHCVSKSLLRNTLFSWNSWWKELFQISIKPISVDPASNEFSKYADKLSDYFDFAIGAPSSSLTALTGLTTFHFKNKVDYE